MNDLERFAKAFQKWEEGFRAEPDKFLTPEESLALEVSELTADRAAYFIKLLNSEQ